MSTGAGKYIVDLGDLDTRDIREEAIAQQLHAEEILSVSDPYQRAKMIVASEDSAVIGAQEAGRLGAINQLADLRRALFDQWFHAHSEECTNAEDCASFGGDRKCHWTRPEALGDYWPGLNEEPS